MPGGVVHACLSGQVAWVLRAFDVERWDLTPGGPPRWLGQIRLPGPGQRPPAVGIACAGPRAAVAFGDGQVQPLAEGGLAFGAVAREGVWPVPRAAPAEWAVPTVDGRILAGGAWGFGLRSAEGFSFWRPAPGALADATWDGEVLWAVGAGGLWRWQPGWPALAPVVLPPGLAGRPLTQVFRDGPLRWVRDADGQGHALRVRGDRATRAAPPGALPPEDPRLRVPAFGGLIEARRGAADLRFTRPDGQTLVLAERAVHALLLVPEGLVVGTEDGVRLWEAGANGRPAPGPRVALGGAVLRLFALPDGGLWAVTARLGLVRLGLERPPGQGPAG